MTKKYGKLLVNLGNVADAACGIAGRGAGVSAAANEEGQRVYRVAGIRWEQSPEHVGPARSAPASVRHPDR